MADFLIQTTLSNLVVATIISVMAHIKRYDHWFRWVEWLALIALWWNPVMWFARHQLRLSEEMACDALVLETAAPEVHQYANSLLNMAELLAPPAIRPPVVASAINSGGSLEQRLKMMLTEKTGQIPAALRMAIVAVAICVLPLGIVCAQDFEAVERRLEGAVNAGELSHEQANVMLQALQRSRSGNEIKAQKRRYMEVARKIEAAVEAGKLSQEEAEEKLIATRREMFEGKERVGKENGEMQAKTRRFKEIAREIEAAVDAGKLSKEDAKEKLIATRRDMFEGKQRAGKENEEMEAKTRRYKEITRKIEAAVEAGKLSKEDAKEKLIAARREMFDGKERAGKDSAKMEARTRRFKEIVREIKAAVEAGKLSKEEAEEKLISLRKEIFKQSEAKDRD